MKKVSGEYFKRMELMSSSFENQSKVDSMFLPEYKVSKEINDIIRSTEKLSELDIERIEKLISEIDDAEHYNGSQWNDYKMHLRTLLSD